MVAYKFSDCTSGLLRIEWQDFGQRTEKVYAFIVQTLAFITLPEFLPFSENPSIGQCKYSLRRQFRNQRNITRRIIPPEHNGQIDIGCTGSRGIDQVIPESLADIFRQQAVGKKREAQPPVSVLPLNSMRLNATLILQENLGMRHFMQQCYKKTVRIQGMIHRNYRRTGWISAPEVAQFAPPGPRNAQYNMVLIEPISYLFSTPGRQVC